MTVRTLTNRSQSFAALIAVGVRIAYGLVLLRIAASQHGLNALGGFGQLLAVLALPGLVLGGGLSRGITQRHAALHASEESLGASNRALLSLVFPVLAATTTALVVLTFTNRLENLVGYAPINPALKFLAIAAPVSAINGLLLSIAAAHGKVDRHAAAQTTSLAVSIGCAAYVGSDPTSLAFVVVAQPVLTLLLCITAMRSYLMDEMGFAARSLRSASDKAVVAERRKLCGFFVALALPLFVTQFGRVLFRDFADDTIGARDRGAWEAIQRLADGYWVVIGTLLALVVLPALASDSRNSERKSTFVLAVLLSFMTLLLASAAVAGDSIVASVYGIDSGDVAGLLKLQATADLIRIFPVTLATFLLASDKKLGFFVTELSLGIFTLSSMAAGLYSRSLRNVFVYQVYAMVVLVLALALFLGRSKRSEKVDEKATSSSR